ncbi:MAG: 4Fe-4S dicluster domain-containing protein [Desulfobacula sp.]|nr:4Fe-4S dicluster domain-containing protein [Desulfobacula sp.]
MNLNTGHHILTEKLLCPSFRTSISSCTRCEDLCPVKAIHLSDNGPQIGDKCIDCGVCFAACPNGVFQMDKRKDSTIIAEVENKIPKKESRMVSISCNHGNASSDLIVPCLGRLTKRLILELIYLNERGVKILQPDCSPCALIDASANFDTVMNHLDSILAMTGLEKHRLCRETTPFEPAAGITKKTVSRRSFLGAVGAKAIETAVKVIPDVGLGHSETEKETAFRDVLLSQPENLKRSSLLRTLERFGIKNSIVVPSKDFFCAEICINQKCNGCGACTILCPTGALFKQEVKNSFELKFRLDLCTNCRECEKACSKDALQIKEEVRLDFLLESSDNTLFQAARNECYACGQLFIGGTGKICPLCFDRTKKQDFLVRTLTAIED